MKTLIFSVIGFTVGAVGGYFAGHIITKKKYCKIADKEVESVKESLKSYYEEKLKESPKKSLKKPNNKQSDEQKIERPKLDVPVRDSDSIDYDKLRKKNEAIAYNNYANNYKSKEDSSKDEKLLKPYVITPEEFSEGVYDTRTLNYYKDGILADDDYNIVKDINGTVGPEALNSFGMYDEDSVYVRNDEYEIDYEILFVDESFVDVAPKGTRLHPDEDDY